MVPLFWQSLCRRLHAVLLYTVHDTDILSTFAKPLLLLPLPAIFAATQPVAAPYDEPLLKRPAGIANTDSFLHSILLGKGAPAMRSRSPAKGVGGPNPPESAEKRESVSFPHCCWPVMSSYNILFMACRSLSPAGSRCI